MKYSWQIISTVSDLEKIESSLLERFEDIEGVLPSLQASSYPYNDVESAKRAAILALSDALQDESNVRGFMGFLRRLFIVSGLSIDDGQFSNEIKDMFDLSNYLERNKDEMQM